jgi:archaeosine synthase beta-subunit
MNRFFPITDRDILAARPEKNPVDPDRPYAFLIEPERSAAGEIVDVATVFLTNRECPFRCLMCDLWKNTTDAPVPPGAIPRQIDYALSRLAPDRRTDSQSVPPASATGERTDCQSVLQRQRPRQIKLYNSGNFFDAKAIPREDHAAVAERVRTFETVIVENHPRLCSIECVRFRDRLETRLEVALGLETVHPQVLAGLNKQMTLDDFARAVEFLLGEEIDVRAFILLKPPPLSEAEGVEWALRSIEYAFSLGVGCCSVVPTRAGNGIMEILQRQGRFAPPRLASMESVLEEGIRIAAGTVRRRVFMDLWDVERFFPCPRCGPLRRYRLHWMNLAQEVLPPIECECGTGG